MAPHSCILEQRLPLQFRGLLLTCLRWFLVLIGGISELAAAAVQTTEAEAAFLRAHPVWRMAGAPSPPFQWTDESGDLQGLASDYRRIIEERLGLKLQIVPAATWDASLEQLRRSECDVSLLTSDTPFIGKPFNSAALRRKVREVLDA